jgi:hypothetical protein
LAATRPWMRIKMRGIMGGDLMIEASGPEQIL